MKGKIFQLISFLLVGKMSEPIVGWNCGSSRKRVMGSECERELCAVFSSNLGSTTLNTFLWTKTNLNFLPDTVLLEPSEHLSLSGSSLFRCYSICSKSA